MISSETHAAASSSTTASAPIPSLIGAFLARNESFVLATIVSRHGSTPRTAGTRMIIDGRGRGLGTIGGGLLEAKVMARSRDVFADGRPRWMRFDMSRAEVASLDMICGGDLEVLLEKVTPGSPSAGVLERWRRAVEGNEACLLASVVVKEDGQTAGDADGASPRVTHALIGRNGDILAGTLAPEAGEAAELVRAGFAGPGPKTRAEANLVVILDPAAPPEKLVVIGAGHVALPTVHLAVMAGFQATVLDDRPEYANSLRFPEARQVSVVPDFDRALEGVAVGPETYLVIVTRGHLHDKTVLIQALGTEAAYIGMIGSRRKRDQIFRDLSARGFTEDDLKRVHSPIGLAIGAETPEEIAVSIVAELIQVRAGLRAGVGERGKSS